MLPVPVRGMGFEAPRSAKAPADSTQARWDSVRVKSILFASLCICSVDPLLSMGHPGKVGNPLPSAQLNGHIGAAGNVFVDQRSVDRLGLGVKRTACLP